MDVLNFIGFRTNWKRVEKMNEKQYLIYVGQLVAEITYLRTIYNYDVKAMIKSSAADFNMHESSMAEDFYKIIMGFGTEMPTTTKYSRFWELSIDGLPSARKVKKDDTYQKAWDVACKWAYEYEKTMAQNIITAKNKRIQKLESELKVMDERLKRLESEFEMYEFVEE
ncbi:MAG: hypothetical protein ACRC8P_01985 [Spiroplasma sp.]